MNIGTYKTLNNQPHLNEALAKFIVGFCLGRMRNEESSFDVWHVGIGENDENINENYTFGQCANHLEALQTKQYLIAEKNMFDDNNEITGNETFIYVYRD